VDDQGEFVDDGTYRFVDDRTIEFGDPPGNLVHFRFSEDQDTVTFDLEIPEMDQCSQHCREEMPIGSRSSIRGCHGSVFRQKSSGPEKRNKELRPGIGSITASYMGVAPQQAPIHRSA
jgi:hypothetical protein